MFNLYEQGRYFYIFDTQSRVSYKCGTSAKYARAKILELNA